MAPPSDDEAALPDSLSDPTLHDLRTPLTIISAQAQMIARAVRRTDAPEAEAILARVAAIEQMVARLALVLDALGMSEAPPVNNEPDSS